MILLCYDGSESSKHAVSFSHQTLRDEPAVLLHVWSPPEKVLADAFSTRDSDSASRTQAILESMAVTRAQEVADEGRAFATELGLQVEVRQARNNTSVWRTILDVANELDSDLIVAGTHGTTAVQENPLGSVSGSLVHHSKRPILIIPAGE